MCNCNHVTNSRDAGLEQFPVKLQSNENHKHDDHHNNRTTVVKEDRESESPKRAKHRTKTILGCIKKRFLL